MTAPLPREDHDPLTAAERLLRSAREAGYAKVRFRITPGGTIDMEVDVSAPVAPPGEKPWRPKVGRR